MKAMKIGLLNKGNLTNYLLWLGRCENSMNVSGILKRMHAVWRFACLFGW